MLCWGGWFNKIYIYISFFLKALNQQNVYFDPYQNCKKRSKKIVTISRLFLEIVFFLSLSLPPGSSEKLYWNNVEVYRNRKYL